MISRLRPLLFACVLGTTTRAAAPGSAWCRGFGDPELEALSDEPLVALARRLDCDGPSASVARAIHP
jgi:hypothetical protein